MGEGGKLGDAGCMVHGKREEEDRDALDWKCVFCVEYLHEPKTRKG